MRPELFSQHRPGITVIELLVSIGLIGLISVGMSSLLIYAFRYNTIVWDQLSSQSDGRRAIQTIVDDVRKAEVASTGAYPIVSASSTEFIFFSNIDEDSYRERIRYTVTGTTVQKGVIKPSGTPLVYSAATEKVTTVAHYVKNTEANIPLFTYYTESYAGSGAAMPKPVTTTLIRVVKVQLEIEKNVETSPVPFHVEGLAQIRNLKTN